VISLVLTICWLGNLSNDIQCRSKPLYSFDTQDQCVIYLSNNLRSIGSGTGSSSAIISFFNCKPMERSK
jgi:hypothetical protein